MRGRRMCMTKSSSKISKDTSSLTLSKHKKNTLSWKNTSNWFHFVLHLALLQSLLLVWVLFDVTRFNGHKDFLNFEDTFPCLSWELVVSIYLWQAGLVRTSWTEQIGHVSTPFESPAPNIIQDWELAYQSMYWLNGSWLSRFFWQTFESLHCLFFLHRP
jgi:hypothetical protein